MAYNNKMSQFLRHPNDHPFDKYSNISEKSPSINRGIKRDVLKMDISKHDTHLTCKICFTTNAN